MCVVGPSGCGKSTLVRITAGLSKPSAGEVIVKGTRVERPRSDIGIVFQNPVLLDWRKVIENMIFPTEILHLDRSTYVKKAMELARLVGLDGFEDKYPFELSGGMQMRVSLARALIHDPSILLLDEPFSSLDAITREAMAVELLKVWKRTKPTVLLVTHDIAESVFLADRVVVMWPRPGRVKEIVDIDLGRPRTPEMRFDERTISYVKKIHDLIGGA